MATLTDCAHRECHDAIAAGIFHDALGSGMRGSTECRSSFAAVLPPALFGPRSETGIIPDARFHCLLRSVHSARVGAERRYRGRTERRGAVERHASDHLFEVKTVHGGGPHYMSARARDDGQAGAVADRAHSVLLEYQAHARRLDLRADVRAHNAGATGAVEARLESFGVVRPLVFGQYGEASLCVHEFLELVARSAAVDTWRALGSRSWSEAYGYYLSSLRRSWGVLAVREMARHRLRRVIYVGAGARPRAQQAWEDAGGRGAWRQWMHASHADFHAYEAGHTRRW